MAEKLEPHAWRNETRKYLEEPDIVEEIPGQLSHYDIEWTPLYSVESIVEIIEDWQGTPDPSGDREVNEAAVKLAEELKERFQSL